MRILVAIVHYFAAEDNPRYGSTSAARRDLRRRSAAHVVEAYRGLFAPALTLDHQLRGFRPMAAGGDSVDVALVTMPGCDLLDADWCAERGVRRHLFTPDNPRTLGFHAHAVLADAIDRYDWFVYSEDDIRPSDPQLFDKLAWLHGRHGTPRTFMPNRFELNERGAGWKTYVDGDLGTRSADAIRAYVQDEPRLEETLFGRPLPFRRTGNPHAGFFALARDQLAHWMAQPHWLDRDGSFISPLESAATLGIAKTFSIYKPVGRAAGFLELQHLDNRYSGMALPVSDQPVPD